MGAEGWILEEDLDNTLGGVAVPKRRDAAGLAFSGEDGLGCGCDFCRVGSDEEVCAFGNGDGALGVFAESETGDAEGGGFFLDAAGIGEDQRGFAEQAEKIEIAHGRDQLELGMSFDAGLRKALLGARMNGKDYRNLSGDGVNRAEQFGEFFRGINVRRTMESEDAEAEPVGTVLQRQIFADRRFLCDRKKMAERIDHDIANEIDGLAGAAFFEEVLDSVFFGDEKIVGQGVGEDAVDFFGHGTVKTAEAGFDVGYRNAKFYGGQRDGDGGVDVADHENYIRLVFEQDGFDTLENFGGLDGMGAGADLEIDVRRGNAHLAEENIGERCVVMLAGVD